MRWPAGLGFEPQHWDTAEGVRDGARHDAARREVAQVPHRNAQPGGRRPCRLPPPQAADEAQQRAEAGGAAKEPTVDEDHLQDRGGGRRVRVGGGSRRGRGGVGWGDTGWAGVVDKGAARLGR